MASGRASLKQKMRLAILTERIDVAGPDVAIFRFRPKEGEVFTFTAGQYATLGLDVGEEFVPRAYSIASSPYNREHLEFYINVINEGHLTPTLFSMRVGDEVYYMGPKGLFTLAKTTTSRLLFVATGTGLAPYMSMLRMLHEDQHAGRPHGRMMTLVHGVRFSDDLGYREELQALSCDKAFNFLYVPMVSRPNQDPDWTPRIGRGRITHLLENGDLAGLPEGLDRRTVYERFPYEETAVYLCGNPDMITDAKAILADKGCREVYTEEYW